ncbi:MAG: hypothetical protein A2898_00505 [Candidatus Kerfeldbacteria bacterium RIFCSPLOWO2_01_FULL_48_11]|uniref:Uncharacterized protein n=1 Tax=Candidatus Kerfeldbacteria bacterium RIFCSPLOWO2_01_FULL_48_11 TaxID=1798543 RepID=A0A1G2B1B9_9BACT|nr:MAG: hypothetical protein UY34_C0019G0033 [Parcubacteria group bacterium GW2011_GWA2_48_9]KKW16059.1 MAG: hypothetical protein UY52_C0011G0047 [Parcubacteria group bacterium GW2011_GWC2_49_9]OGY82991.1 MAG: hypothetical protein A2898_00505 [Candidatus Kerfeldbacteria bacterium RIFCSPLOWO2_01_FULL_48_11]HCM68081.1 hypothetical protein [Candidatus Kerfeldbacteria bacterium]
MKKIFISILIAGIAGFLLWKFVLSLEKNSPPTFESATPSINKDKTIYDDALLDLEDARETLK